MPSASPALLEVLEAAQRKGFIGPGPLEPHVEHAGLFTEALEDEATPGAVVDLGSGGGLPALPAALACPDRQFLLVESQHRRAEHLRWAVQALALADRVQVEEGRAEVLVAAHRGRAAAVMARAFGPPATTAECAAPFLAVGGVLVVSEPPGPPRPERWDEEVLAGWGQELGARREAAAGSVQVLFQRRPAPDSLPRREGMAAKRPRF